MEDIPLATFDGDDTLSEWELFSSSESVSPTFTVDQGYVGNGAKLSFTLTNSTQYVQPSLTFSETVSAYAISFWVKSPPNVFLLLDITHDQAGAHSFPLHRPIQATDPDQWVQHVVMLDSQKQLRGFQLRLYLADNYAQASSTVLFDEFFAIQEPITFSVQSDEIPADPLPHAAGLFQSIIGAGVPQWEGVNHLGLSYAESLNTHYIRAGIDWWVAEPSPGIFDTSRTDPVIDEHEKRGMKTIFVFIGGNLAHTGEWYIPPQTEEEVHLFGDYVEAIASHYKGRGLIYEIWPEPENTVWNPRLTVQQFAAILVESSDRIRRVDPSATIMSGGILSFSPDYVRAVISAGGLNNVDAFGVHSYNIRSPEYLSDKLYGLRAELNRAGFGQLPIWDPEWGICSFPFGADTLEEGRLRQARLVARQYLSGWANGLQAIATWSFIDRGTDPYAFETCGLLDVNYNEKPAYQALYTLSQISQGRILSGIVTGLPSNYFGLRLDGRSDVVLLFWTGDNWSTDDLWAPLTVTVPISSTVMDYLGNPVSSIAIDNTLLFTMSAASGPVYSICPSCATTLESQYLLLVMGKSH